MENLVVVVSPDRGLKVTLVSFDAPSQIFKIRIEELSTEKARYHVAVKHGDGCQTQIDYATYDVNKHTEHSFFTLCNEAPKEIEIVRVVEPYPPNKPTLT